MAVFFLVFFFGSDLSKLDQIGFPHQVTELQGGGTRGRQILYFCNLEAHQPQIFRKCYFFYLFHITEKDFF